MLDFLLIFSAAIAGFFHAPVALVLAVTGGLLASSFARRFAFYDRGISQGSLALVRHAALLSGLNALVASAVAFGGGMAIRLLTRG
jgi:hypothetical protein